MSKELFSALTGRSPSMRNPDKPRFIKPKSDEGLELMSKADVVDSVRLGRSLSAMSATFDNQRFYIVSGIPYGSEAPRGFRSVELTPDLFQLFWHAIRIPPSASDSDIKELLDERYGTPHIFSGFDIEEITTLFPNICCYQTEIDLENFPCERFLGYVIVQNDSDLPLDFTNELRDSFAEIFEYGSGTIPFAILLQGLVSIKWGGMYVQIYRCIEQLFSISPLKKLHAAIKFDGSKQELAQELESKLSWRPKDAEALQSLVESLEPSYRESFLRSTNGSWEGSTVMPCAKRISDYRNSEVHFRLGGRQFTHTDAEWSDILISLLTITRLLYDELGDELL